MVSDKYCQECTGWLDVDLCLDLCDDAIPGEFVGILADDPGTEMELNHPELLHTAILYLEGKK